MTMTTMMMINDNDDDDDDDDDDDEIQDCGKQFHTRLDNRTMPSQAMTAHH